MAGVAIDSVEDTKVLHVNRTIIDDFCQLTWDAFIKYASPVVHKIFINCKLSKQHSNIPWFRHSQVSN